ncbi:IS3 family transposase [Luteimonas sp. A478]
MHSQREGNRLQVMCRLYGVTAAGYYAWRKRPPSATALDDVELVRLIRRIFEASAGCYGSPRVHAALRDEGIQISNKRVARLMREHGLKARSAKLYRRHVGHTVFYGGVANSHLDTPATRMDHVWVGDVTYLKVRDRWRYLAVVMDRYSRLVIGWTLGLRRDVSLTLAALNQAVRLRRPSPGVLFHSDRGSEYASYAFRDRLRVLSMQQSMNRPRYVTDNAAMESFFKSLKSDIYHGVRFDDDCSLRSVLTRYITYYNELRLHSSLGYRSPVQFEAAA